MKTRLDVLLNAIHNAACRVEYMTRAKRHLRREHVKGVVNFATFVSHGLEAFLPNNITLKTTSSILTNLNEPVQRWGASAQAYDQRLCTCLRHVHQKLSQTTIETERNELLAQQKLLLDLLGPEGK